jgi:hypothetical protein
VAVAATIAAPMITARTRTPSPGFRLSFRG